MNEKQFGIYKTRAENFLVRLKNELFLDSAPLTA